MPVRRTGMKKESARKFDELAYRTAMDFAGLCIILFFLFLLAGVSLVGLVALVATLL